MAITTTIPWRPSLAEAEEEARTLARPVFVDIWAHGCSGCEWLEAATYPDPHIAELLGTEFVPVKLEQSDHPEAARRMSLHWTPTLTVLHHRGATVRQWIGFLPPDRFRHELQLALAVAYLRTARPERAAERLRGLDTPEALYWLGVAAFRRTGEKAPLWDAWRELAGRYPDSTWAVRTTLRQPDWTDHPLAAEPDA